MNVGGGHRTARLDSLVDLDEWSAAGGLDGFYAMGEPLRENGLRRELWAAIPERVAAKSFMADFAAKVRQCSAVYRVASRGTDAVSARRGTGRPGLR